LKDKILILASEEIVRQTTERSAGTVWDFYHDTTARKVTNGLGLEVKGRVGTGLRNEKERPFGRRVWGLPGWEREIKRGKKEKNQVDGHE